jgi:uncharacterized protein (DUF1015 family)
MLGRKYMATVRPFRAIRPVPEKALDVSSVPYDVVDTSEARLLAENNPHSFLHVIRPEIDLPEGTDLYDEAVYKKGAENFARLIDEKILILEEEPCIYLYRLIMGSHEQVGIAACCSVHEYDSNIIVKHEHTRKEKEDDRVRHMLSVSAHHGPVLMTYRGNDVINRIAEEETLEAPLFDFTSHDGIRHTMWRAQYTEKITQAFKAVPFIYIADGHHRAAGASRVRQEMLKNNPGDEGDEEFNYFLAVLFPSEQMKILAYNRYVSDLSGLSEDEFLQAAEKRFIVNAGNGSEPSEKGTIGMYLAGKWYELKALRKNSGSSDPVSALDLSIFQEQLLTPVLGIKDQKSDRRIDFIGGEGSMGKLKTRVDAEGGAAFTFFPVSVSELLAVADAGRIMPPKSTWFVPKLRSGLLTHRF